MGKSVRGLCSNWPRPVWEEVPTKYGLRFRPDGPGFPSRSAHRRGSAASGHPTFPTTTYRAGPIPAEMVLISRSGRQLYQMLVLFVSLQEKIFIIIGLVVSCPTSHCSGQRDWGTASTQQTSHGSSYEKHSGGVLPSALAAQQGTNRHREFSSSSSHLIKPTSSDMATNQIKKRT